MTSDCPRIIATSSSCDCVRPCSPKWYEKDYGDKFHLKQLSREELEMEFCNLHTKHTCLTKASKENIKEIKRLNKMMKKNEEDRKRCLSPTKQLYEDRISQLEQTNSFLQDKILVLRHQLQSHSRLHAKAHRNTRTSHSSITKNNQTLLSKLALHDTEDNMNQEEKNSSQEVLNVDLAANDRRILQLENELAQHTNDASRVAENIELIRLRRLVKIQSAQLSSLTAHSELADKELDDLRVVYKQANLDNDQILKQLAAEKQRLREMQIDLIELGNLKQDVKILQEQVRDLQSERTLLRNNNDKLLEIASGKSEDESSQQKIVVADAESNESSLKEETVKKIYDSNNSSSQCQFPCQEVTNNLKQGSNHCCDYNTEVSCCSPSRRCQSIRHINSKHIMSLNYDHIPLPTCYIACCQSSKITQKIEPVIPLQDPVIFKSDIRCRTKCPVSSNDVQSQTDSLTGNVTPTMEPAPLNCIPVPVTCLNIPPVRMTNKLVSNVRCQTEFPGKNVKCQTESSTNDKLSSRSVSLDPGIISNYPDSWIDNDNNNYFCQAHLPPKVCAICCHQDTRTDCSAETLNNNYHRTAPQPKPCGVCGKNIENLPNSCSAQRSSSVDSANSRTFMKQSQSSGKMILPDDHVSVHEMSYNAKNPFIEDAKMNGDYPSDDKGKFKACVCGCIKETLSADPENIMQPPKHANEPLASSKSDSGIHSQSRFRQRFKSRSKPAKESQKNTSKRSSSKNNEKNTKCEGTFTLWIESLYLPNVTMEYLNRLDPKPYVYLTWTYMQLEDKVYSTILPAGEAIFNCSSLYKGEITLEMLHYMCSEKVKIECHSTSQLIASGEIDVSEAIYKPNTKCKYRVCLVGPNDLTAVISCWFKFDCPKTHLQGVLKE